MMTTKMASGPRPYLYFAYGSNLNIQQMMERCPKAIPVRRTSIVGLRLVFRRVADVVEDPDSIVHGALWRITDECERALNKYEGYKMDQTGFYRKSHFKLGDEDVMLYYMNPKRNMSIVPPSPYYLHTIVEGYQDFHLNTRLLFRAVERSIKTSEKRNQRARKNLTSEMNKLDLQAIRKVMKDSHETKSEMVGETHDAQ